MGKVVNGTACEVCTLHAGAFDARPTATLSLFTRDLSRTSVGKFPSAATFRRHPGFWAGRRFTRPGQDAPCHMLRRVPVAGEHGTGSDVSGSAPVRGEEGDRWRCVGINATIDLGSTGRNVLPKLGALLHHRRVTS